MAGVRGGSCWETVALHGHLVCRGRAFNLELGTETGESPAQEGMRVQRAVSGSEPAARGSLRSSPGASTSSDAPRDRAEMANL